MIRRRALAALLLPLAGCAAFPPGEPLRVGVADLQALPGEGMELRFLCLLRVQNPNDKPLAFNGVALDLEVRGSAFASGVSESSGTVPAFGEILVSVPVSAPAMNLAGLAIGLFMGRDLPRLQYRMHGRIGYARFEAEGEITLPRVPR